MSCEIEYRLALHSDMDGIISMYADAIAEMDRNGILQWDASVYPTVDDIKADIDTQQMYVGLKDGKIVVAYTLNKEYDEQYVNASWKGGDNFIIVHRLCVSPSSQHQGIARHTMEHIHDESRGYGIKAVRLDAFTQNPYAISLYENLGYRKRGEAEWRMGKFNLYEKLLDMQTERILLRRWQDDDAQALFRYASDPDVGPRAGWPPHKSVEESLDIIRTIFNNPETWAIVLKKTNEPIGAMGYFTKATSNISIGDNDCEVGYWVAKPYWNHGICTEALELMLDYCLNVKHYDNIWSDHFIGNPASGRVMEKCGFEDTGRLNRCSQLLGGDKEMVKIYKLNRKSNL